MRKHLGWIMIGIIIFVVIFYFVWEQKYQSTKNTDAVTEMENSVDDSKAEEFNQKENGETNDHKDKKVSFFAKKDENRNKYEALIDTYAKAVEEGWKGEDLLDVDIVPPDNPNLDIAFPETLGYIFQDLNGNGHDELIVGHYFEDEQLNITDIYQVIDNKVEMILTDGLRAKIDLYEDGTVSFLYGDRSVSYYEWREDGDVELVEGYERDN